MPGNPVLEVSDVTVSFSGNLALDAVSLSLQLGSFLGLVGENGAGKSTLLNVLSGTLKPDHGRIMVHGQEVHLNSPHDATRAGIFRVHQEQALIGQLTVAENLVLGFDKRFRRGPLIATDRLNAHAQRILNELGIEASPARLMRTYSFGARQLIELARVVSAIDTLNVDAPIVLLDEPTAVLSASELSTFVRYLEILKSSRNASVVFISHRLDEVIEHCDAQVVLKDGAIVATPAEPATAPELHKLMVGRERAADFYMESHQRRKFGVTAVEIDGVSVGHLQKFSLTIHEGEISGIAGLPRSGKHELAAAVFGASRIDGGEIRIAGRPGGRSIRSRIRGGLAYVPLHRSVEGISRGLSVQDNISNASWSDWSRLGLRQRRREARVAKDLVAKLRIRTMSVAQHAGSLSGGNQQKVVFARWVARKIKVLIADNPTRGVDAGAKEEIYQILRQLAADGTAILIVSDDLPELIGLSNTISVLRDGQLTARIDADVDTKPEEHLVVQHMV